NTSGSIRFSVPGQYFYFCRINPSKMNGVVTVKPGAQPAPVARVQGVDPALPGESLRFDPPTLDVPAGSSILFANVGGKPHTFTADDGSFDTGVVTPGPEGGRFAGTNATVTLDKPGAFPFHCEIHPQAMRGTVRVTGQATKPPGAASTAPRQVAADMADFEFKPPQLSVAPGGQVTWTNRGQPQHTAPFDDVQLAT